MTRCVDPTAPTTCQVQDFYRAVFTRLVLLHMLHPDWTAHQVRGYLVDEGQDPAELDTMLASWGTEGTDLPQLWERTGRFAERNADGLHAMITVRS